MECLRSRSCVLAVAMVSLSLAPGLLAQDSSEETPPSLLMMHDFQGYAPLGSPSVSSSVSQNADQPQPGANVGRFQPTVPLPAAPAISPAAGNASLSPVVEEAPLNAYLQKLQGIVILGAHQDFKSEGVGGVRGLKVDGPAFLKGHQAMLSVWLGEFLGKPLGMSNLNLMQEYLIRACRQLDRPVVDVYYPQQEIIPGEGVVQIIVYEGKVGHIDVVHKGGKWFSDAYLTNQIHLRPGDSISQKKLLHEIEKLNRDTQFLEVSAFYKPANWGSDETNSGATDIGLVAKERFPLRLFAGYDNYGLDVLGENQMFAGFNYGNLFGAADQLNYQYTTDIELSYLQAHTASFIEPLPWGHTLTIFGGYNAVQADLSKIGFSKLGLRNNGYTYQVSLRYIVPLPHWGGLNHDLSAGYDFKSADTTIVFDQPSPPSFAADVDQFTLGYKAVLPDRIGSSQLTLDGYYSPGGLLGKDTDAEFSSFHAGLKSDYYYGRAEGDRIFYLGPETWANRLWLLGKAGYQNASTGLLPSEQLYLGGHALLRGYPEDIAAGDQGYYATVELHSPILFKSNLTGQKNLPGQPDGDGLDIYGFYDYGAIDGTRPNTTPYESLDSAGAGLSYHISQNLKVDFSYGFQLKNLPSVTPVQLSQDHSRAHIAATLAY
jgi:hemolysin activation/secretion protein